jgi:hypothetical protein
MSSFFQVEVREPLNLENIIFRMAYSACFLIEPTTTSPGAARCTVGWALPHQNDLMEAFSTESLSYPITRGCIKLHKTSQYTILSFRLDPQPGDWVLLSDIVHRGA